MGRHARSGRQRRGRIKIAVIAGTACLVAGGTAAAVTATRGHSGGAATAKACPHGTVTVVIRADPSATSWLGSLAARYAATHHQVDGKCVVPEVSSLKYS